MTTKNKDRETMSEKERLESAKKGNKQGYEHGDESRQAERHSKGDDKSQCSTNTSKKNKQQSCNEEDYDDE